MPMKLFVFNNGSSVCFLCGNEIICFVGWVYTGYVSGMIEI